MAGGAKEYGPFHRFQTGADNELVSSTGFLGGRPIRNIAQGVLPRVKAHEGPLPPGRSGIEFMTTVEPDKGHPPLTAFWTGPRPGVEVRSDEELALISVRIIWRVDDATSTT
jgi:hypothetical protein